MIAFTGAQPHQYLSFGQSDKAGYKSMTQVDLIA